jgi:hypothetical protein
MFSSYLELRTMDKAQNPSDSEFWTQPFILLLPTAVLDTDKINGAETLLQVEMLWADYFQKFEIYSHRCRCVCVCVCVDGEIRRISVK